MNIMLRDHWNWRSFVVSEDLKNIQQLAVTDTKYEKKKNTSHTGTLLKER